MTVTEGTGPRAQLVVCAACGAKKTTNELSTGASDGALIQPVKYTP